MITNAAIRCITWYQREVSPGKGFSCAYRVRWGGHSCSGAVKDAFERGGLFGGIVALPVQAGRCFAAAQWLSAQQMPPEPTSEEGRKSDLCATWAAMEGAWWCCFLPLIS